MSQPICPECHAVLEDDLVTSTGSAECPFCGADVGDVAFDGDSNDGSPASTGRRTGHSGRPADSTIEIVESTRDRLVIHIPPGGKKTRSIGCFAIAWNGFMAVFTSIWLFVGMENNADAPLYVIIPFLGLFWLVGLGMAYWWVRMRFMRLYLLIDPSRVAIQRILFGRKSLKETHLAPNPYAELVESYQENDVPVYAVAIEGTDRTAKFGTALSREEKSWLVATINTFFGHGTDDSDTSAEVYEASSFGSAAASNSVGDAIEPISPDRITSTADINILDADASRLRFQLAPFPKHPIRYAIAGFCLIFGIAWLTGMSVMLFAALGNGQENIDIFPILISVFFLIAGTVPLFIAFAVLHGGVVTVDLTRDQLQARWHLGPMGIGKKVATDTISSVSLRKAMEFEETDSRGRRRSVLSSDGKVCMIQAAGNDIPLTSFHNITIAREVGGIILYQLDRMGVRLPA
jgi:hypothetical protein